MTFSAALLRGHWLWRILLVNLVGVFKMNIELELQNIQSSFIDRLI